MNGKRAKELRHIAKSYIMTQPMKYWGKLDFRKVYQHLKRIYKRRKAYVDTFGHSRQPRVL